MSEEEANQIRAQNEEIRKQREEIADGIATKFSCFKRDFLGAPIRKAMNMVLQGKDGFEPCQIDYRKEERFWVFGSKDDISCTFEVSFDSVTDQALARIFLLELNDSKRNVVNAPAVLFHDKTNPENVLRVFPGAMQKKTSNGSITFSVSSNSIKKGIDQPLSQLIGFRQYLHFHLHAIKIQLHSRMRKRVESMELIVK